MATEMTTQMTYGIPRKHLKMNQFIIWRCHLGCHLFCLMGLIFLLSNLGCHLELSLGVVIWAIIWDLNLIVICFVIRYVIWYVIRASKWVSSGYQMGCYKGFYLVLPSGVAI
jgi:hypothetical protein